MELLYGAINKRELNSIKNNINKLQIIHINNDISKISLTLIESYSKSHNLQIPDAIIAATSLYENISLLTYNVKDFKFIEKITLY